MNFIFEFLSALCIICIIIYVYYQWSFQYWKRRNIPFIQPTFPFGNLSNPFKGGLDVSRDFYRIYKEFKSKNIPYGGIFIGPFPNLFIVDLDFIKTTFTKDWRHFMSEGSAVDEKADPYGANLFNMDGDKWKEMRPKLSPIFTSGKMKSLFPNVLVCGNLLEQYVHKMCLEERPLNTKKSLEIYIAEVLGNCVFGLQCNTFENPKSEFIWAGHKSFEASPRLALRRMLSFISPSLVALARLSFFPNKVTGYFRGIIDEVVSHRQRTGEKRSDMMQALLDMTADPTFSIQNLSAHAIGFYAAGFETSAITMTFCLYELARRPDIQAKIRREIHEILKKNDGQLTYEGIVEMKYLDKAINETLRYYPTGGLLQRMCTEDYPLPNGAILKKGTMIFLSQFGIQRDEDYYPEPDNFDPERFSDEVKAKRPATAFTPFGEGPRVCLGIKFAFMQIKIGLISILKQHEVSPDESVEYPMVFKPNAIFMTPKHDILLKIRKF